LIEAMSTGGEVFAGIKDDLVAEKQRLIDSAASGELEVAVEVPEVEEPEAEESLMDQLEGAMRSVAGRVKSAVGA
jgi:hypothetical protein